MEHSIADSRRAVFAGIAYSGRQPADQIRLVAGLAIACGGAAVFLSDLIARVGATG